MSWTEEKVAKLKELWGKGNTASQIAEIIGGISRNAVIGKAHRLNLSAKIKTRSATSNENFENSIDNKKLVQVIDVLGRKVINHQNNNQILFYIYDDGSVEKIKQ